MSLLFTVRGAWKKITTSFSFEARREDSSVFQVTRGLYERARAESAERPIIEQRTVWTRPARQRPAMLRSFSRYTRALSLFSGTRWILSSPMSTTVSFFFRIDEYLSFPLGRPLQQFIENSASSASPNFGRVQPHVPTVKSTPTDFQDRDRCLSGNRDFFEMDSIRFREDRCDRRGRI